jgi:hypothetical protein
MRPLSAVLISRWLSGCVAFVLLGFATSVVAQISAGGTPPSFSLRLSGVVPTVQMSTVDVKALLGEDKQTGNDPFRFAAPIDVLLNLKNSGVWESLSSGGRLWRLRIFSPGAYSIGFIYNDWYIPKGGRLFLYNDDHSQVVGAFTAFNNWKDGSNITQHVSGDAVTLEYLEPAAIRGQSRLSISQVCHAYRNVFGRGRHSLDDFGGSGLCNVNINCADGALLQDVKHGVALIVSGGYRICTGSLINNTARNGAPYFLTANHCLDGSQTSWIYYFNYESAICTPTADGPTDQTVANGTVLARYQDSDFALLRISSDVPASYNPYFNGWDNRNQAWIHSYNISHPSGDVKKLAVDYDAVTSTTYPGAPLNSHWRIGNYEIGTTEAGSSGSPLFDAYLHITGQLHGGDASCTDNSYDAYGKFSMSWAHGGTPSTELRDWLDPPNTTSVLDGAYISPPGNDLCPGFDIFNYSYTDNGTTAAAHYNYSHAYSNNSPDVVYTFHNNSCENSVTVSLCGSGYDTELDVRTGGDCPGSSLVVTDDDYCGANGPSQVTFTAAPNTVYYFIIYGDGSGAGIYTLNVTSQRTAPGQTNDMCPGPTISTLPYTDSGSICTVEANYTNCVYAWSPEVVYTLIVDTCQIVTVSLCGSNFDTQLGVYAGGACPGNTIVACNDDDCYLHSRASFVAQPNTNYYILVGGWSGDAGNYTISVTGAPFRPANDMCPGTTIVSLPYSDTGNTASAVHDYAVACIETTSPDVVYNFTPAACETVIVSLCGSTYDAVLDVRTGGACPGALSVGCNDDSDCDNVPTSQSTVSFASAAGVTYYFIVSGFNGFAGPFVINVTAGGTYVPSNDVCPGTTITALPFTEINSTACDAHSYQNSSGNGSPDAVYNFTSGSCQIVSVSLCGSGYDTGLSVYRNGYCPGYTLVAGNEDNFCGGNPVLQSALSFQAAAGMTYFILVHGHMNAAGPYVINVTGQPCALSGTVDSLVIVPYGSNILLGWKSQGPVNRYNIYRSAVPEVPAIPANKLDSTTLTYYVDSSVLNGSATQYFYTVTIASLPTMLAYSGNIPQAESIDKTIASATSDPWFATDPFPVAPKAVIAKRNCSKIAPFYIPAYSQFNTKYVPDPNKHGKVLSPE